MSETKLILNIFHRLVQILQFVEQRVEEAKWYMAITQEFLFFHYYDHICFLFSYTLLEWKSEKIIENLQEFHRQVQTRRSSWSPRYSNEKHNVSFESCWKWNSHWKKKKKKKKDSRTQRCLLKAALSISIMVLITANSWQVSSSNSVSLAIR